MFSIKEELETKKNPSPQSTSEIELLNIADEEPSTKSKEEKEEGLGQIVVSDIISSNILEEVLEEKEKVSPFLNEILRSFISFRSIRFVIVSSIEYSACAMSFKELRICFLYFFLAFISYIFG